MRRITSALFLDFDNVFSRLVQADASAAMALVADPTRLIERLATLDEVDGVRRDILVRRAYLNPNGMIPDPCPEDRADVTLVPISQHRAPFTRAGFEVIDCPRFIKTKNGADIRMVIDALDLLAGPTRYDEVIVASSDSDFTPLLIKLRAHDRRTTIITTGTVAVSYGAAADRHIGESELIALLAPPLVLTEATDRRSKDERRAIGQLNRMIDAAPEGASLAALGLGIRHEIGSEVVTQTKWFGHKTLTGFIRAARPDLEFDATRVRRTGGSARSAV
ncbi:MAG: NYN domain-containing protein [Aquihabitans sp.]